MTRFDTDSSLEATLSFTLFADSQDSADEAANIFINTAFGNAMAGMLDLQSFSHVNLTGMDIVGANYTYNYALDQKFGDSGALTPVYNTFSAGTPDEAYTQLVLNAQRITNQNNIPLKINYLKESP